MLDPLPATILQVIFIVFAALCTGVRAAVSRVNDYKMEEMAEDGNKKAKRVLKMMESEAKIVSSLRMATTTFLTAICGLGIYIYTPLLNERLALLVNGKINSEVLSFVIVIIIHIIIFTIFADLVPRKIFTSESDNCAMSFSGFAVFMSALFRPVTAICNVFSKFVVLLFGGDPDGEVEKVTEDDVKMMVDLGSEKGTIAPEEKELITNIFEFGDLSADDVMTHRKDVTVLMLDESATEWEEIVRESGFSRFPVCGEDIDDIVGVVYARELYEFFYDKGNDIKEIIHQAYIVPEKISADLLFKNMQKEKTHFAIVADEYGGFAGIVTMDDLLGCIVGEIENEEYDEEAEEEREDVVCMEENLWDVDGLTPLEELCELTGANLPVDEFDTLSGVVLDAIEYIPDDGTVVSVEAYGLHIEATEIKDRRIVRAIVRALPKEEKED